MSTRFIREGTSWSPVPSRAMDIHEKLPPGNYLVKATPTGKLYFEEAALFSMPPKYYGGIVKQAERIISTTLSRAGSTGVLLAGEKGSGKTLLGKLTSDMLRVAEGMPTIIIAHPIAGEAFNQLMQAVEQPAVVLFDEFEKVYGDGVATKQRNPDEGIHSQNDILTLLDGAFPTRKLWILTVNDQWKVDRNMHNRPGRLFYNLAFTGLEPDFIRDYCADKLKDQSHADAICKIASIFGAFNFDMLQALVEEMNRYNETPFEALKMLNIKPETESYTHFDVEVEVSGVKVPHEMLYTDSIRGNPLAVLGILTVAWKGDPGAATTGDPDMDGETRIELSQSDLAVADPDRGAFVYRKGPVTVTYTRRPPAKFNLGMLA